VLFTILTSECIREGSSDLRAHVVGMVLDGSGISGHRGGREVGSVNGFRGSAGGEGFGSAARDMDARGGTELWDNLGNFAPRFYFEEGSVAR
jgi:hypothetical protein